jgi:hypothetical protein
MGCGAFFADLGWLRMPGALLVCFFGFAGLNAVELVLQSSSRRISPYE